MYETAREQRTRGPHNDADYLGLSCGACVRRVTRALDGLTGVVDVNVDLRTNEASVEHLPGFVDAESLIAAVRDAGYAAQVVDTLDGTDKKLMTDASPACGCGCCGGEPAQKRCLYHSKGDDLDNIIADDQAARKRPSCAMAGCALGVEYTYCD